MGKKAKTRRALERRKQKRNRKEAQRRLYEQWAQEGRNRKSKRFRLKTKRTSGGVLTHRDPNCRNIGDVTQYPAINLPFLAKMYLMKRAGIKHQYTGKHTQIVREFVERHNLIGETYNGKFHMWQTNDAGTRRTARITDTQLFALAA